MIEKWVLLGGVASILVVGAIVLVVVSAVAKLSSRPNFNFEVRGFGVRLKISAD